MIRAIQSQYEVVQISRSTSKNLAPGIESLMDLMDMVFKTRQERHIARVACFSKAERCGRALQRSTDAGWSGRTSLPARLKEGRGLRWMKARDARIKAKRLTRSPFHRAISIGTSPASLDKTFLTVCEVVESVMAQNSVFSLQRNTCHERSLPELRRATSCY